MLMFMLMCLEVYILNQKRVGKVQYTLADVLKLEDGKYLSMIH